jgi:hypothetical protein
LILFLILTFFPARNQLVDASFIQLHSIIFSHKSHSAGDEGLEETAPATTEETIDESAINTLLPPYGQVDSVVPKEKDEF